MQGLRISSKELSQSALREGRNMNIFLFCCHSGLAPGITRQEGKPVVVFATFGFILTEVVKIK